MLRMLKLALNCVCVLESEATGFSLRNILLVNLCQYLPHCFSKVSHLHAWIQPHGESHVLPDFPDKRSICHKTMSAKCIFLLSCPCRPCVIINNTKVCHSIDRQMTLMNWLFLVYQKHTAQPVKPDSWTNDSFDSEWLTNLGVTVLGWLVWRILLYFGIEI